MPEHRPIRINLEPFAYDLLQRAKRAIGERNLERQLAGRFTELEGVTVKDIVTRGIALVAREVNVVPADRSRDEVI